MRASHTHDLNLDCCIHPCWKAMSTVMLRPFAILSLVAQDKTHLLFELFKLCSGTITSKSWKNRVKKRFAQRMYGENLRLLCNHTHLSRSQSLFHPDHSAKDEISQFQFTACPRTVFVGKIIVEYSKSISWRKKYGEKMRRLCNPTAVLYAVSWAVPGDSFFQITQ